MSKRFITAVLLIPFVLPQMPSVALSVIEEIPEPVQTIIDSFFEKLTANQIEEAVQILESHMVGSQGSKKRQSFQLELTNIGKLYGKRLGLEKLYAEYRGESLIEVRYLYKSEDAPLVFYFLFYKPTDQWLLDALHWNEEAEALFH